jgi:hypothetical protein
MASTMQGLADFTTNWFGSFIAVLGLSTSSNGSHFRDTIEELKRLRLIFKQELLLRDGRIQQTIAKPTDSNVDGKVQPGSINQAVDAVADLSSQTVSMISSYSPALLAEVREWQQAAHVLACIDTAIPFISGAISQPPDPLADQICDAMFTTILTFPLPTDTQPAEPRPDDLERVMDRRVMYDEPQMHDLISSFDDPSRSLLKAAAERERSRLPLFPAHFGVWNTKYAEKLSNPSDPVYHGLPSNHDSKHGLKHEDPVVSFPTLKANTFHESLLCVTLRDVPR